MSNIRRKIPIQNCCTGPISDKYMSLRTQMGHRNPTDSNKSKFKGKFQLNLIRRSEEKIIFERKKLCPKNHVQSRTHEMFINARYQLKMLIV